MTEVTVPCLTGWDHDVPNGANYCRTCGLERVWPDQLHARIRSNAPTSLIDKSGGWRCYYCHTDFEDEPWPLHQKPTNYKERGRMNIAPSIDHLIPQSRGGTNHIDNKVLACRLCNQAKMDLTLDEWRALGFPRRIRLREAEWLRGP